MFSVALLLFSALRGTFFSSSSYRLLRSLSGEKGGKGRVVDPPLVCGVFYIVNIDLVMLMGVSLAFAPLCIQNVHIDDGGHIPL